MDTIPSVFRRKKANFSKLVPFGFVKSGTVYTYRKTLLESGFVLTVEITADGRPSAEIFDPAANAPYTLHLAPGASGSFVGKIKAQYDEALAEIAGACFDPDIFKLPQTMELIEYVRRTYANELEFLWERFPDNAIWRRTDNQKWYGIILTVPKSKLGLHSDEAVEIIDLRIAPEKMAALIDHERYFPGWHMNKKHWYTILLDGSVPTQELCRRIDKSYLLAKK